MELLASGGSIGVFLYLEALQIGLTLYVLLTQDTRMQLGTGT